jgi:hypothetical protein
LAVTDICPSFFSSNKGVFSAATNFAKLESSLGQGNEVIWQ